MPDAERCAIIVVLALAVHALAPAAVNASVQISPSTLMPRKHVSPALKLAHAIVVRTSPAQGEVVSEDIGKVDVWYDAGIRDDFAALAVTSESGDRVDKRDAAIDIADPSHVSTRINVLAPGKYTVRYRALSADGHIVTGKWDFEIHAK